MESTLAERTAFAERLLEIEDLADVPVEQFDWILENGERYRLEAGSFLFQKGETARGMHVLLSGSIEMYMVNASAKIPGRTISAPAITGVLPFSRLKMTNGYGICLETCELLTVPIDKLPELVQTHYELTRSLVHMMTGRVRQFAEQTLQNEKMMALGKMSAGLAHELNNPAAAIARSSQALLGLQAKLLPLIGRWQELDLSDESGMCSMELLNRPLLESELSLLEKRKKRSALEDVLESFASEQAGELADSLVESGIEAGSIEKLTDRLKPDEALALVEGMAILLEMRRLSSEVGISARRISELVGSVKRFTHMDRGLDKEWMDMHQSIRDTLTLMNHKTKSLGIVFEGNFRAEGPKIHVHPGELGQILTNLIDNAIDALEARPDPKIRIETLLKGEEVLLEIEDNGSGIPKEIADEIFKPFFTTKTAGKGTGMGLEISRQIAEKMGGRLSFESEPGKTVFRLALSTLA